MKLTGKVKIFISGNPDTDHGSLSRGTAKLLAGIDEFGSLNKAAKSIGMAYSKAWNLLNNLEENFQTTLVVRSGANGSHLTPQGKKLLECYYAIEKEAEELVEKRMKEAELI